VHAEGPAEPPDRHEQVNEFWLGRQQLRELVEDDEERRQRGQPGPALAVALVVADRPVVSRGPQQFLAAHDLALQRVAHPVDQRQFLLQVGDDRRNMAEALGPEEGRAALEVDQHEVQHVRGVGQREAEHQRPEQLGFA
jgi:hypothetical protein